MDNFFVKSRSGIYNISMASYKKKLRLIVFLGVIILILLPTYFIVADSDPGNQSNFTLCTGVVTQPACYPGTPTPLLNWTVDEIGSSQAAYRVQIDDASDFLSLAIDTADTASVDKFYQVAGGLSFNTLYYWRVRIQDNVGSYSDWEAVDSFTTNPSCNSAPTATNLSVVNGDYCATASHFFSWTYSDADGNPQSEFDFQVDDDSGFSSPQQVERMAVPGAGTDQSVVVVNSPGSDQLGYNTTYYWRVRVYDGQGTDSGWVSGSSFTTALHQYPSISFSSTPSSPSQDEDVQFTDTSTFYGGASRSALSWIFADGNPGSSSIADPIVQFLSSGSKQITLQVTDSDGFTCSDNSQSVNVGWTLPDWREILPW